MTKRERQIVSSFTGILMCDIADYQNYVEEIFERPVLTHELGDPEVQKKISKQKLYSICRTL